MCLELEKKIADQSSKGSGTIKDNTAKSKRTQRSMGKEK